MSSNHNPFRFNRMMITEKRGENILIYYRVPANAYAMRNNRKKV
jgi:hypothetical protein